MIQLTDEQIDYIVSDLRQRGLYYVPLIDELIDHVCCRVEAEMDQGRTFDAAYAGTIDAFGRNGIRATQCQTRRYVSRRPRIMRRAMAVAAAFIICVPLSTLNVHAIDPPSIKPLKEGDIVRVSSSFGQRYHPILKQQKHHNGIDFVVPLGTPVLATADGVVREAGPKGAYGVRIEIEHDAEYASRYSQLSEILVEPGLQVKKGDVIGYSGNSGQSTGPHLHYEVLRNGTPVNPANYFSP